MNEIARKYFLPILLGSIIVFAVGDEVHAKSLSNEKISFNNLEDSFWGKFRDSVMKDKDKNDPNGGEHSEPSRGGDGEHGGQGGRGDGHGDGPPR